MKNILIIASITFLSLTSSYAQWPERYNPGLCNLPNGDTGAQCIVPTPIGPCFTPVICKRVSIVK